MKKTERHLLMIDVLLENAGIPIDDLSIEIDVPSHATAIQANLNQRSNGGSGYLAHLIELKDRKIENISFIVGRTGNGDQSDYTTTKPGIIHL